METFTEQKQNNKTGQIIAAIITILTLIIIVLIFLRPFLTEELSKRRNGLFGIFGKVAPDIGYSASKIDPVITIYVDCEDESYKSVTVKLIFYDQYNMMLKEEFLTGHDYQKGRNYPLHYYISDERILLADHYKCVLYEYK